MSKTYRYNCSKGHYMASVKPEEACRAYVLGEPCPGTLKPYRAPRRKKR